MENVIRIEYTFSIFWCSHEERSGMETRELKTLEDLMEARDWHLARLKEGVARNDMRSCRYHLSAIFSLTADMGVMNGADLTQVENYRHMAVRVKTNSEKTIMWVVRSFLAGVAAAEGTSLQPKERTDDQ